MTDSTGKGNSEDAGRSENLADSPMMAHLMQALKNGEDIGHYGRLTFVMVARYFMSDDEMVDLLANSRDFEENDARALVIEVNGHGCNPPKRARILQWQSEQEFRICPTPDDPNSCNVYRELRFPDEVYDNIGEFWEEQAQSA